MSSEAPQTWSKNNFKSAKPQNVENLKKISQLFLEQDK